MRKVTVPVDMTSEQKTLLGVLSKRQLIYLLGGGASLYLYVPFLWRLFAPFNAAVAFFYLLNFSNTNSSSCNNVCFYL